MIVTTFKKWLYWRVTRLLVKGRKYSYNLFRKIERIEEFDEIQKLVYKISIKLIHDPHSILLNVNGLYQIRNNNYMVVVKQRGNNFCIHLMEFKNKQVVNSFNEIFDIEHMKIFIDNFNREVMKRMKNSQSFKETKIKNHLNSIVREIDEKI